MCVKAVCRSLWVLLLSAALSHAYASVIYVNRNATGAVHDGKSWATAFLSVQAGVNAAWGDEVWVAAGTYNEAVFIGKSVALYGGFAGTEQERSQRDWKARTTALEYKSQNSVTIAVRAQGIVLDGLSIRNGTTGVDVDGGRVTMANCTFTGNTWEGARVHLGYATVNDCTFSGNDTGVMVYTGSAVVEDCVFSGQRIGIECDFEGDIRVDRCLMNGNSGSQGLYVYGGSMVVANSLIRGFDYGVFAPAGGMILTNCTICDNLRMGVYQDDITMINCIVAFNPHGVGRTGYGFATRVMSHNNVYGNSVANYDGPDHTGTNGNISQDPMFVNRAGGDYRLRSSSPCIDAGDDWTVSTGVTDLDGNPRTLGAHVDLGAYEVLAAMSISLGTAVSAPPAVVDGVAYVGGMDGKLYAYTSPALQAVPGFPVDVSAAVGAPVSLNSRPAVYYGGAGKAIYLTTDKGHVVKVRPSGQVAWVARPVNGPAMSTPAVTPLGSVYVDLGLASGASALNFVFKLDEVTGRSTYISPYLGSTPAGALSDRSAAIDQRYCYVNAGGTGMGSLAVLNQDNLTVRASFAPGEDALPPYLAGQYLYLATKAGNVYKLNGTTMSPDLSFGSMGQVRVGEKITAGPFVMARLTVGTASGKLWTLDKGTGAASLLLDTGTGAPITGLLVTQTSNMAFGAGAALWQVPAANPAAASVTPLDGAPVGGPVYDPTRNRMFAVTANGRLYSVPGL